MAPEYNTGEQLGFSSHSMTAMRRKNKQQKNQSKTKQNKTTQRRTKPTAPKSKASSFHFHKLVEKSCVKPQVPIWGKCLKCPVLYMKSQFPWKII